MKNYEISFNNTRYSAKPSGDEIGKISNRLYTKSMDYRKLAAEVGEFGCTFSPAVYDGRRRKENYIGQQLVGLDFDSGITFSEVKSKAEHYRLPILFAYKTFSWTKEHEKFRVIFALSDVICDLFTGESVTAIFMKIFEDCDAACKDVSRMFFGGKGLLELSDTADEISGQSMLIAFVTYMHERYGANHYTREIKKFYQNLGVRYNHTLPVIEDGRFIHDEPVHSTDSKAIDRQRGKKVRRTVTRNLDWNILYKKCQLYRDFADGTEYFYYPQLFHIAANLVNIEKGKKEFIRILKSECNSEYEAYHNRDWSVILNTMIEMDYQPENCCSCPYEKECLHAKNMILTAKPGKTTIIQTEKKDYVSIREAEEDLKRSFHRAIFSVEQGIHIIRAQTGIGKTNLYLDYLNQSDRTFLIAVPTHKLKMEVYNKALSKGVRNIAFTPEMPEFSYDLQNLIKHTYTVGAGEYVLTMLREIFDDMKQDDKDYIPLKKYLEELTMIKDFKGHIITTHERLMLMKEDSEMLSERDVIIDEDIMRTMLSTHSVSNDDILHAIESGLFPKKTEERLRTILASKEYQRYDYRDIEKVEMTDDIFRALENIEGNILDLAESCYVFKGESDTVFLKRKWLPCSKAIIMSATANEDVYRMFAHCNIYYYPCKMAEYMGELKLYPKYSFSRYSLNNHEGIMEYLKDRIGDDTVITFKAFEDMFDTQYHFGAVEGLNCLEGKNISVVGLPNVDEVVYKLYGMAAGVNVDNYSMRSMRVNYNGYSFEINSFDNMKLRTIQLWMLESLLEQAVGRARLLRFNCTVKVFARFPIDQAKTE